MKKTWLNYSIDIIIGLAFIALSVTGILKYPRIIHFLADRNVLIPSNSITAIHRCSGLVLSAGVFLHMVLHWRWLIRMTARLLTKLGSALGRIKKILPGIIGISFFLLLSAFFLIGTNNSNNLQNGLGTGNNFPEDSNSAGISIRGIGDFSFDPSKVESIREDVFADGAFSVFDILAHLDKNGKIEMDYYFDEKLSTNVIDSLGGESHWWYTVVYDGGWGESNVFRMDLYPYKEGAVVSVFPEGQERIDRIYETFARETERKKTIGLKENGIIIPEVEIQGLNTSQKLENVVVKAHNLRSDLFKDGVITAIDVIMSLGDQGKISYDLKWYDSIGSARIVRNYFVQRIDEDESRGRCGFVYDSGSREFYGFRGNHIHLPSDSRVLTSPDYIRFFWICV